MKFSLCDQYQHKVIVLTLFKVSDRSKAVVLMWSLLDVLVSEFR